MDHVQHGGALDKAIAAFGGRKAEWLDLSTGINPNPYPIPNIPGEVWHRLPDEDAMANCLAAARTYYGVSDDIDLLAAPGTQAFIQLLPRVIHAKKVWIVGPTYSEYERVFGGIADVRVAPDLPESADDIDLVIVGSPNNPDGRVFDHLALSALGKALNRRGGLVLVDAAFADVLSPHHALPQTTEFNEGILVLRSFGKFFGLAGLRLGFAVGAADMIDRFQTALGPWAVSGPALFLGESALRDHSWVEAARSTLSGQRASVETILSHSGFAVVGSTDLFVTGSVADSTKLANALAHQHILVRTFDHSPNWVRFGLPADQSGLDRLELALAQAS